MLTPLDIARSQLGIAEKTGRNDGIPASLYGGDGLPWCAAFIMWCFEQSDQETAMPAMRTGRWWKWRACAVMWTGLKQTGHTIGPKVRPEPGDIIFFYGRMGSDQSGESGIAHVGIISTVEDNIGDGWVIETIEGNTSNKVAKREYVYGDTRIAGFARP